MSSFVGRRSEMDQILTACHSGGGRLFIRGTSGVGKSRLLNEAGARLEAEGWRVISVAGSHAARRIPMGALASLLPEQPTESEALLMAHVLRSILGETDGQQVFVCVDDAHLLDDASLAVIAELIRTQTCVVAMVVTTGEELPSTLRRILLADGATWVDIGPMSHLEVMDLAARQLGAPLTEVAGHQISEASQGRPLMLRELLIDATDSGVLTRVGDEYGLSGDLSAGLRMTEVIGQRVRRLTPELRDVMEQISVAEPVSLALIHGRGATSGSAAIDALERRELVRVNRVKQVWTVRTNHGLIGHAIRDDMSTSRRLEVLGSLCKAVEAREILEPHEALAAAEWFAELGSTMPPAIAAAAAWDALVTLNVQTAVELATPVSRKHWRAAYVLAEVARWRNDVATADGWLAQAAVLSPDDTTTLRVALARSALEAWQLQDPKSAIDVLRTAADQVSTPILVDLLLCEAAFLATTWGEFDDAVLTAREVLSHPDVDPMTVCTAGINLCYSQVMLGDTDGLSEAIRDVQASFEHVRHERPEGPDLVRALAVGERMLAEDLHGAVATAVRELGELRRTGSPRGVCAALSSQALLYAADSRAKDVAFEGVAELRQHDPYNALGFALGHAALMAALNGDVDVAIELLAEVGDDKADPRSQAVLGRAAAAIVAHDDPEEAARIAIDSGVVAAEASHFALGVLAVADALAYVPPEQVAPTLVHVSAGPTAPLIGRFHNIAHGLLDTRVEDVLHESRELEAAGAPFLAAQALTACAGTDTDPVRARRSAARAAAHVQRSGWLELPVAELEGGLSARENEIALAAADGKSDRQIAADLFLSPRTVGNHLHRTYIKLGIEGREGLAAILGPEPTSLQI